MKRTALLVMAAVAIGVTHAANAPDFGAIQKDVKILTRIFETALGEDKKGEWNWSSDRSGVEGLYLANQGMLFTFDLPGNRASNWIGMAPIAPPHPIAPVATPAPMAAPAPVPAIAGVDGEDDMDEEDFGLGDIEEYIESVIESTMHNTEFALQSGTASKAERDALRAKLRELQKAQQAHEKQVEQMQEKMESLEEKTSSQDKAARAKAMESLDKARQALRKSRDSYRNTVNNFRAEQGKRWKEQVNKMQDELLDTLCNYAGSARRVPENENVTLLFRNVGNSEQGPHQIFVLKRSDIVSCVTSAQGNGYLRKRALTYSI